MRLLHAGGAEVVEDDLGEVVAAGRLADGIDELVVFVDGEDAVGRDAFDGEGAGHAHLVPVLVGLVVEVFVVGLSCDGGVDLLLAGDALLHHASCSSLTPGGQPSSVARGISHSSQLVPSAAFSSWRSGSRRSWKSSQMTSISALLAMARSVMCGTRSYTKPWRMSS